MKLSHNRRCLRCKKAVPETRSYYCSERCQHAMACWRYRQKHKRKHQPREVRLKPKGRICTWCGAADDEVNFIAATECEACNKTKRLNGECSAGHPPVLMYKDGCQACSPPVDCLKVLLVEDGPKQRERHVYRTVWHGKVNVANRWRVIMSLPMVVVLPTEQYVRIRR